MEEVYVVKVKTRPEPSKLYPSERRYSAVTVGGLGLLHALLAATTLLLAALGIAAEGVAASYGAGIALGLGGCGAATLGILAWRRWYVDNNIRYFLVASVVSGLAAIVCIVLTAIAIATLQEDLALRRLSLRHNLPVPLPLLAEDLTRKEDGDLPHGFRVERDQSDDSQMTNSTELIEKFILAFENQQNRSDFKTIQPNETYLLRLDEYVQEKTDEDDATDVSNVDASEINKNMEVQEQMKKGVDKVVEQDKTEDAEERTNPSPATVLNGENGSPSIDFGSEGSRTDGRKEVRNMLSINILIASFLELAWSLLSIRIAWKGVTNDYPDDDTNSRVVVGSEKTKAKTDTGYLPKFMKSAKANEDIIKSIRKPDIISNHQSQVAVVKTGAADVDQYLPQEESSTEYHERVRRFLASNNDAC